MASPKISGVIELRDRLSSKMGAIVGSMTKFEQKVKSSRSTLESLDVTMNKVSGAVSQASGAVIKFGSAIVGAGVGWATAKFVALKALVAGIGAEALKSSMNMEGLSTSLAVLLKSQENGAKAMQFITKFASNTPYEIPELTQAVKMMASARVDYQKWVPLVGDLASGTGASIEEVTRAIGRLNSGDFGESFERLRDFGISKIDLKEQGLRFSKSGEFLGSTEQALNAVEKIIQARFAGMMDKQSKTLRGVVSNIQDNITQMYLSVMGWDPDKAEFKAGSLYDRIRQIGMGAKDFLDELRSMTELSDINLSLWDKLGIIWDRITDKVEDWWTGGGKQKIEGIARSVGGGLADMIMTTFGIEVKKDTVWTDMGRSIGKSFVAGFKESFDLDKLLESSFGKWAVMLGTTAIGGKLGGLPGALIGGALGLNLTGNGLAPIANIVATLVGGIKIVGLISKLGEGASKGLGWLNKGNKALYLSSGFSKWFNPVMIVSGLVEMLFSKDKLLTAFQILGRIVGGQLLSNGLAIIGGAMFGPIGILAGKIIGAIIGSIGGDKIVKLIHDNWKPISDFFTVTVPDAFRSMVTAISEWLQGLPLVGRLFKPSNYSTEGRDNGSPDMGIVNVYHGGGEAEDEQVAILKRKEMVLPADISTALKSAISGGRIGKGGNVTYSVTVPKIADTVIIEKEVDAESVVGKLVGGIKQALPNMGNVSVAGVME